MRKRKLRSPKSNQQRKLILKSKLRSPRVNQQRKLDQLSEPTDVFSELPMIHQIQPTPFSCLPAAFAMCLGVPVSRVLDDLGHTDHFYLQELQILCMQYGYISTYIEKLPETGRERTAQEELDSIRFFNAFMLQNTGVIIGETHLGNEHAVAWDSKFIYDPAGSIRPYDAAGLEPWAFILVKRFPKSNIRMI